MRKPDRPVRRPFLLPIAAALTLASPLRAQNTNRAVQLKPGQRPRPLTAQRAPGPQPVGPRATTPLGTARPPDAGQPPRPAGPVYPHAIAPQSPVKPTPQTQVKEAPPPARPSEPPATEPVDKKQIHTQAKTVVMSFDKRDLSEVIQFVSQFTQRNFILPERVSGKITILSNSPIPADEVWNVFVAALDANNWAVYPVGKYWKLVEKKQSSRANVPLFIDSGSEPPATEQMVTKLFKLHYVEADQMRNVLNQFTSRDSDFQIFPPDTLIISDLGLNMRRLEKLVEQLDQPGGSEEIHVVPVQYAGAQELAQKLTEIFTAQSGQKPGAGRQIGVVQPGQPMQVQQTAGMESGGPLQVSKILAEERTNKLIVIAGGKSFSRVMELVKQLDVPTGEGGVHVYYLENAKAEEVASTLQALAQGLSSTGGAKRPGAPVMGVAPQPVGAAGPATAELFSGQVKITADKNTNSLVVIASQADYRNLVKVVERLDIRRRQVFVEAVIMEVNLEGDTSFGAAAHGGTVLDNVSFRGAKGQAPLVIGSEPAGPGFTSLGGVTSLGSLGGFLAGLQGPPITVPGTNFALPSFAILLNALQSSSDVNVISTPHVIMTDNTEGEITVGQNVPFQAAYSPGTSPLGSLLGSQAGTTTGTTPATSTAAASLLGLGGLGSLYAPIQRQNVELRLRIKPQINESDYVRLEVDEQTEEIASTDPVLGPTTSKRTAKTTVVAKDQETVVLGGLIQERTLRNVKKVPVLGSIPVLGWLFRNETTKRTKTNLLLFLTPYIIRDQSDYRRIFERKMAERAEFVKRFYGEGAEYETTIDYSRKLGPLSHVRLGVQEEMEKFENGGPGSSDERVIGPVQRYAPKELDKGAAPRVPSPAPVPAEPKKEPPPGVQAPQPAPPPEPEQNPGPGR